MGRSSLAVAFIAIVFAVAIYFAQRPTRASGDVLGAELVEANAKYVREVHCPERIEIESTTTKFKCTVMFKDGERGDVVFEMDREGMIHQAGATPHDKVKRTSDPWGD
jgi:hypothetical protein